MGKSSSNRIGEIIMELSSEGMMGNSSVCVFCNQKIVTSEAHARIENTDFATCKDCIPKATAVAFAANAVQEKRDLSVEELRKFEKLWQAKGIEGLQGAAETTDIKLPDNATRFQSITLDKDRQLVTEFTCPKCSNRTKSITPEQFAEDTNQWDVYMWMQPQIEIACPHCQNVIMIFK